jgi:hypothetical protein
MHANNTPFFGEKKPVFSIHDALAHIEFIKSKCMAIGANDYEISELNRISTLCSKWYISSQEAVAYADAIVDSKQSYH